ncbi:hypothetical protein B0I35DRAFT_475833 [Stachybotrys elegans]|uniref:Histone deacetylase domain-containing protein n=1 Tax=Stachybotrys elegans TaxID=80388 RepID=A0A8K0SZ62_9HYPO|nr:hypothetical protein B0I35DRAFT_475833 [Stachybotrys elegans]
MSSNALEPTRLHLTTNDSTSNRDDDADLTKSLQQLSISTSPAIKSPRSPTYVAPLKPPSRHSSPSQSPVRRNSSRSSSKEPHATSPTLVRKASTTSLHSSNGFGPHRPSSRRSSTTQMMPLTSKSSFGSLRPTEEKPPLTPNQVAKQHFEAELEALHKPGSVVATDTIVVLHDAVYGHRFSRPRTSRNALSTIVERPERIKASVLGISAAYVRLGERHCDGTLPPHPQPDLGAVKQIPFRIHKTERTVPLMSPAVTNVHGTKWMEELAIMCDSAEAKLAMGGKELQRPDIIRGPDHAAPQKLHEGDLYLCSESRNAMEGALGAVCEAVDSVLAGGPKRAFVGVRPPGHHCSASYPSGFCWVNNVHVGIMHGILTHGLTHAAIIDFDLHHGDGSQDIVWQHNTRSVGAPKNAAAWKKTSIGYFSLHDINSYPCEMGDAEKVKNASLCIDNAHGQTVWNVHLQNWDSEEEFWRLYESKYSVLLEKTRSYLKVESERLRQARQVPKAIIFLSAGFDASEWESGGMQRHQVNVPTEFYARLTQDVVKIAAEEGLGVEGRVISVLEGGYSDRALFSGVLSHLSGLVSDQSTARISQMSGGLGSEMGSKIGTLTEEGPAAETAELNPLIHRYDPSWWSSTELDKLEGTPSVPTPPRKPRTTVAPTYSSPTQASTAKCIDPAKMRRSLSGLSTGVAKPVSRPSTPPPPDVSWEMAAHELCNLLVPSHRQTDSCKAEDLNAEATRARRDRQSMLAGIPAAPPAPASERPTSRMALRERRAKAVVPSEDAKAEELAKNRRKTVATSTIFPDKAVSRGVSSDGSDSQPGRRASRRLSGASVLLSAPTDPPTYDQTGTTRPLTAQSVRPESVASVRAPGGTRPGAKPRQPAGARKEAAPRAPRGTKKSAAAAASAKPGPPARSPASVPAVGASADDDIDKITTGMKKIKINLITQSQREAREKARLEAERTASSPVAQAPRTFDGLPTSMSSPLEPHAEFGLISPTDTQPSPIPVLAPDAQIPPQEAGMQTQASLAATELPGRSTPIQDPFGADVVSPELPPAVRYTPRNIPSVSVQPSSDPADVFIPYQPDGPAPVAVGQTDALTWLPPNAPPSTTATPAATPSPVKKNNLFQYTAGIPFAPRLQKAEAVKTDDGVEKGAGDHNQPAGDAGGSVWDIPETPQKQP